jgi:methylated-DNA-[protein]-cysteine S-methyltransferase
VLTLVEEASALVSVSWGNATAPRRSQLLDRAFAALDRYFAGAREDFDLPLRPAGSPFQQRLWDAMRTIPWGSTTTYGALARRHETAPRAVASACARNPLPIFIPCHRVIAAEGSLAGYSGVGGVLTKRALLCLEGALPLPSGGQRGAL